MNELGNNIKILREAKKMSQPVLADRLGVTRSTISAYENGTRSPSYDVLIQIAKLFNINIDILLGFSKRDTIDVSELTQKQRDMIQVMTDTFKNFNNLYKNRNSNNINNSMQFDKEFYDYVMDMGINIK